MILPLDTYISQYQYRDNGTITINGMSGSPYDLADKLEKSPYLKDVSMKQQNRNPNGKYQFYCEMKVER
jgi:hypothetical protein